MASPVSTSNDPEIRRARALARILDTAVGIPGTPLRIGVDAILGVIPGAGDVAGAALAGYIVLTAAKKGMPAPVLWRMVANVAIDTAIGSIPVLGDLFDVAYKANIKNVQLLERFTVDPTVVTTRSRRLGAVVVLVLVLVLLGLATLGFLVARLIWRLLTG
jgi:hypothetical protein